MPDFSYTVTNSDLTLPPPQEPPKELPDKKPNPYVKIPEQPVMEAVQGIKFDFNDGLRIKFPQTDTEYALVFMDVDTGTIFHQGPVKKGAYISSMKKFYIKYRILIFKRGTPQPIFEHTMDLKDKQVAVLFPDGAVGDTVGWFSYMERFQKKHNCRLTCVVPQFAIPLFQPQYPDIKLLSCKDQTQIRPYATYYMGLFFRCNTTHQPMDFRQVGLHRTAAYILGVDPSDIPPRVDLTAPRKIQEKYCVISTQASSMAKHWNNPQGWDIVIRFLRDQGYKVYCINKERNYGDGEHWYHIPWGVQDVTGERPWQERVDLIKDADFYIGLSSGASWVAWCCGVPIVLISGFTLPFCQFNTPYRVINFNGCTGCWDDRKEDFDHRDFMWCPRHKGTPRMFQCTKIISPQQVINTIKTIPSFRGTQSTASGNFDKPY